MSRLPLHGRVVVVLGGAKGIGAATARRAASAGATVVVADRNAPAGRIAALDGLSIERVDVTDPADLTRLRDATVRRYGRIHAVINCAAIIEPGPVVGLSFDAIRRQFEVNALGSVLVSTTFLPRFRTQGFGHLVLVASLGGITPLPESAAYSATKFAVRGWGLALAQEVRRAGVHVTVVCPDSTDTAQLVTEARGGGAPLSFTSAPMRPERVARAIVGVLRWPRREVCVPFYRGWLCKLAGASPLVFRLAYPMLQALGVRARARFSGRPTVGRSMAAPMPDGVQ